MVLLFCYIWELMDQVWIMYFSKNFLMSCMKRKVLVFWTWELAVFAKFIMHTKQPWKNWNLSLISLLWTFILFSNFQVQDEKAIIRIEEVWFALILTSYSSCRMNYRNCKRFLINSPLPNKYKCVETFLMRLIDESFLILIQCATKCLIKFKLYLLLILYL